VKRLIFIAGGVGVNPLMSMLRHLAQTVDPLYEVIFIYTVRGPSRTKPISSVLFLEQLIAVFGSHKVNGELVLHLTIGRGQLGTQQDGVIETSYGRLGYSTRRVTKDDLLKALGPVCERSNNVCYICGVPSMTDEFVEVARGAEGMDPRKVLFERWW
jgi:NAD(P)H-flavin reductase